MGSGNATILSALLVFLSWCMWTRYILLIFFESIDLLDHIKAGLFDKVCLLPSASTWSRLRHSDADGQPPLRTRAFPLGLKHSTPPVH